MFGLSSLNLVASAAIGAALIFGGGYFYGRIDAGKLTDAAVEQALSDARAATENAINELADEADKARVRRRLCIDDGSLWSFADNDCIETETQP